MCHISHYSNALLKWTYVGIITRYDRVNDLVWKSHFYDIWLYKIGIFLIVLSFS